MKKTLALAAALLAASLPATRSFAATAWTVKSAPASAWPQFLLMGGSEDGRYAIALACGAAAGRYAEVASVVGVTRDAQDALSAPGAPRPSITADGAKPFEVPFGVEGGKAVVTAAAPEAFAPIHDILTGAAGRVTITVGAATAAFSAEGLKGQAAAFRDGCLLAAREAARAAAEMSVPTSPVNPSLAK
jgi:hypothetical protein